MPVEIVLNTPLADALNSAIQPKLVEVGWGSGGADDSALSEYIILMLVNGKTQDEIASELSGDLLNLGPDDPGARDFSKWLFDQIDYLSAQLNGGSVPQPGADGMAGLSHDDVPMDGGVDISMDAVTDIPAGLNAPTGPRSMRNGNMRGGRERRMIGSINRALDRSSDSVLHRVRGQTGGERINTHTRTPPTGPRMGAGRQPRVLNGRATNIAAGLAAGMGSMPAGPAAMGGGMSGWMMPGQPPPQMDIYTMLEQQSRMMQQMQQQILMQSGNVAPGGGFPQNQGKSLFERVQRPHNNFRKGPQQQNGHSAQAQQATKGEGGGEGEDVEMSQVKREPPNPDDTICKYNLNCTNKDCKFAHQSPAAPPGITVDVKDVCGFGAACKNKKCVGRHPSPATKVAHQSEQDCKFFPNCQNPRCPFRHPTMPPCRNGGDCAVPNCKYTHVKTACKYHPCTNRFCPFKHEEGQRGTFQDKVWVADGAKDHVSERKFVDDQAAEDIVLPGSETDMNAEHTGVQEVVG